MIRLRVLLQFPEGLKAKAFEIAEEYKAKGDEVFVSGTPCFGACDIQFNEAKAVNARLIVHFGHAEFPLKKKPVKVEYREYHSDIGFEESLSKALKDKKLAGMKKIGLVTTVQHVHRIKEMKAFLEKAGKTVFVGKHGPSSKYDGQVLGCDLGSALNTEPKVDCILYFGGGIFHPRGIAIAVNKPVLACDPFLNKAAWMDEEKKKYEKRLKGMLTLGIQANKFAVLVSTKPGQFQPELAEMLKKELESIGKEVLVLVFDFVSAEGLTNFNCFDFYVNTACPRIGFDDYARFDKPVLNAADALKLVSLVKNK